MIDAEGPGAIGPQPRASGPPEAPATTEPPELTFDGALAELTELVGRLEGGGLPLEESIALYERGVELHRHCAALLDAAELRVRRLVEEAGGSLATLDLRPDDESDAGA